MFRAVTLCGLFMMALSPCIVNAMTADQAAKVKEHFENIGMQCLTDNPITEADISDMRSKKAPTGAGAPCFLACMMKKIGVMDDGGMLQKETVLELARKVFEEEEEISNIADFLHSCASVNSASVSDGSKGCERAMLAYSCMLENAPKFGLDF